MLNLERTGFVSSEQIEFPRLETGVSSVRRERRVVEIPAVLSARPLPVDGVQ